MEDQADCGCLSFSFLRGIKKKMDWEGTKQEKGETKDDDWKTSPLGTDLKMLVNNEKFSDVSFIVGDEKVKMFALKGILSARSKVFCRMFEGTNSPAQLIPQ